MTPVPEACPEDQGKTSYCCRSWLASTLQFDLSCEFKAKMKENRTNIYQAYNIISATFWQSLASLKLRIRSTGTFFTHALQMDGTDELSENIPRRFTYRMVYIWCNEHGPSLDATMTCIENILQFLKKNTIPLTVHNCCCCPNPIIVFVRTHAAQSVYIHIYTYVFIHHTCNKTCAARNRPSGLAWTRAGPTVIPTGCIR